MAHTSCTNEKPDPHLQHLQAVLQGRTHTYTLTLSHNHTSLTLRKEKTDIYLTPYETYSTVVDPSYGLRLNDSDTDLLYYLTRWLTEALHSLLPTNRSPGTHNAALPHVITDYFTASSLFRDLPLPPDKERS